MKRISALAHLIDIAAVVHGEPIVSLRRILIMLALTMPAIAGSALAAELESIVRELAARLATADEAEADPPADRPVHEVPPHY